MTNQTNQNYLRQQNIKKVKIYFLKYEPKILMADQELILG